jgi:MoaA/NifB/PqqE/SkfB family radical SAM enzyme
MKAEDVQWIQIEPTSHCNAKCPHCPRFDWGESDVFETSGKLNPHLLLSHIDIDSIEKNLQIDKLTSLKAVSLQGDKGDPMMHPKIEKFIELFSQAPSSPLVSLNTNGSIRNPEWWKLLAQKKYPRLKIIFSIDGLEDTNHLYRIGIDYKKIIDNARAFIDAGGYAVWNFLVFKHNQHQIDEIYQLSKDMGFSEFWPRAADVTRFKGLDKWPVKINNNIHYLEATTNDIDQLGVEYIFKYDQTISNKKNTGSVFNGPEKICPNLVSGHLYITHQSHVIPCCMMHFITEQKYFGQDHFLEMTDGLDKHDLSINNLETILTNKFFTTGLYNSLISNKLHHICESSCSAQIDNNIKKIRMIKKNDLIDTASF